MDTSPQSHLLRRPMGRLTPAARVVVAALLASGLVVAAAQDPAVGRASLGGEDAVFVPARGLLDPAARRVSILFVATPLAPEVESRARRAGAWPADLRGPRVLVELDYAATSAYAVVADITACRVQFLGFRTPLELKGGAKNCFVQGSGGQLTPGSGMSGLLEGKTPSASFRLPFAVAFLEVPTTTAAAATSEPRGPAAGASAPAGPTRYDHRVVVATTSRDRELDVESSLERNVNALAALGYELTTMAGGDPAILDQLLNRRPLVSGLVDHAGFTFAIMARPVDRPAVAREYRLLHTRTGFGVDQIVAPWGPAGFHMTVSAFDGEVVHVAFEHLSGAPASDFRVFRNRGRRTWMDQALADPDTRMRITHVVPLALDAGVVELGPPAGSPADMQWLSSASHNFTALEGRVKTLAASGYRVELLRSRADVVAALMLKPAGVTATGADVDLDDGPWGGPCSRGTLAGAAVLPDGDVACAADRSGPAVANRGLDLTLRPQPSVGGQILFRGPDCDIKARLTSPRAAAPRVALAAQLEREINRAIEPGFRVVRALAAKDSNGQMRLVTMTSDAAPSAPAGPAVAPVEAPPLVPEVDGVGDDLARQREARLNLALAGDARFRDGPLWVELDDRGPARQARVLGCVRLTVSRDLAASAVRGLLVNQGLTNYRVDNRVIVDR